MAVQQQEKGMGVLALLEHGGVLGIARGTRLAEDFGEFLGTESRKHRQMGNQRTVDRGHVSSLPRRNHSRA
jgi:hypothetical protein